MFFIFISFIISSIDCFSNNLNYFASTLLEIKDCFFKNIINSDSGGLIRLINYNIMVNIQYCSFFEISSDNSGGVLYFEGGSSNFYLNFLCVSQCSCKYTGQFCDITQGSSIINEYKLISFDKYEKIDKLASTTSTLALRGSSSKLSNINQSSNIYRHCSILFISLQNIEFNFFTSINNHALHSILIHNYDSNCNFNYNNILNNTQAVNSWGLYLGRYKTSIFDQCIFSNNNYYLISLEYSSILTIQNSFINHSSNYIGPCIHSNNNNSYLFLFTFNIKHISTFNCYENFILKNSKSYFLKNLINFKLISLILLLK